MNKDEYDQLSRNLAENFGHELALSLKNVFEEKPLMVEADSIGEGLLSVARAIDNLASRFPEQNKP